MQKLARFWKYICPNLCSGHELCSPCATLAGKTLPFLRFSPCANSSGSQKLPARAVVLAFNVLLLHDLLLYLLQPHFFFLDFFFFSFLVFAMPTPAAPEPKMKRVLVCFLWLLGCGRFSCMHGSCPLKLLFHTCTPRCFRAFMLYSSAPAAALDAPPSDLCFSTRQISLGNARTYSERPQCCKQKNCSTSWPFRCL